MLIGTVNWIAVLIAALVAMAIGFVWYGKGLFGMAWMKEMGLTPEKLEAMKTGMGKIYLLNFIMTVVQAYVLYHVLILADARTLSEGITTAFWMWLGFSLPLVLGSVLWENKSYRLFAINAGYWLVSLSGMAIVIALWNA